jgi:hypothetical protein
MMGTVIVVAIGHRVVGRFEVVSRINQRFQLTPVGLVGIGIEDAVQLFPPSGYALEKVQIIGIGIGGGIILAGFNQSLRLTLGAPPGTGLGITEDLVQLGPHSGFALESREPRDIAGGSGLVGVVVPDVFTPFRPSYGRNQGQIGMGWCGE